MIYLYIHLSIGLLFWARNRFSLELLRKHDWTELRPGGSHAKHVQKRNWLDWIVTGLFHLIGWPILLGLMILMFMHAATGWLLGKIAG